MRMLLASLAMLVAAGATAQEWAGAVIEGDPSRGQQLASAGMGAEVAPCATCHGMDGKGDPAAGVPRIAGQPAFYLTKQLDDFTTGHRVSEVMAPIAKNLNRDQKRDVSLYYAEQAAPASPAPAAAPEQLARGKAIVERGLRDGAVQGCANCHGPEARGLPPNGPVLAGQHPDYLKTQLRKWRSGERKNDSAGVMRGIASELKDEDVEAVAAYLASVRP